MYNNRNEQIFNSESLEQFLRKQTEELRINIDKISVDEIAANSDAKIIEYYQHKYSIEPLNLDTENKTIKPEERNADFSHNQIKNPFCDENDNKKIFLPLHIPYSGDPSLWHLRTNSSSISLAPRPIRLDQLEDQRNCLIIEFQYSQNSASKEQIKRDIASEIENINSNINSQKIQLIPYNNGLKSFIENCLKKRKDCLKQQDDLITSLDIPIKPKSGMPKIDAIKVKNRIIPLHLQSAKPTTIEPGISEKIFLDILAIIRWMGRTFEETPKTFAKLEEEDLRNIFLAALNCYFEGEASGEIFRKNGKTDICIKEKGKSAFVAECKIWHGQQSVTNALDQLLNYLTWRDCKDAIIIFNKDNANFSTLLKESPNTIKKHRLFSKELQQNPIYEGEWDFVVKHKNDAQRELMLHVFVFDLKT